MIARAKKTWHQSIDGNILRTGAFFQIMPRSAPVAKLDKAPVYETGDYRFESCRVRHFIQ